MKINHKSNDLVPIGRFAIQVARDLACGGIAICAIFVICIGMGMKW